MKLKTIFRALFFFASLCGALQSNAQIVINEFMAANSSAVVDPDYGNTADWIELYNTSSMDIDLSGYYLTDNLSDTTKWMIPATTIIPANGFLVFWADGADTGLHTVFNLSSLGEELGLYDAGLNLIDGFIYAAQETDISYGRGLDGAAYWLWFSESTPGTSNNLSIGYEGITYYQTAFSQYGGFFDSLQNIELISLGGTIYYTLDGRTPTEQDLIYSAPIEFDTTTFIRARVFESGFIPGPTITQSYFFDNTFPDRELPVVSLVTNPEFFWDSVIGIYVQDFKPEWEQPLNIELFENDGNNQSVFNQQAGVKINGLYSWQLPQKMLGIYFRKQYGAGNLDYPIFHDRDRTVYSEFMLRASGSDWSFTLFRDGLCQSLTQENAPVHNQGFRPSIVFINGKYMGIHNMRSRTDADDIALTYGFAEDSFDIINNDGEIEEGTDAQYQYMDSLFNTDLTNPANYQALSDVVDLTNFTDYWITEMWCSNSSWGHNVKMWKPKFGGKWQFIFGDLDRGFTGSTDDPISEFSVPVGGGNTYDYGRNWLQHIFQNQDYADYFALRFNDHLYTTYHPVRVGSVIDFFHDRIDQEVPNHVARWSGTTSSYGDAIPSVAFWENEVLALKQFAQDRQPFMMSDLESTFGLDPFVSLGTSSLPDEGGRIRINEFMIPGSPWSGPYFTNMNFNLTAIPNPGFVFEGWSRNEEDTIFGLGETWSYLDNGSDAGTNWSQLSFDDSSWPTGNAELGYGDGDETTVVSFGPDAGNKYITTYFRKEFTYSTIDSTPVSCVLKVRRDDGVVIYHNGVEILRSNMPTGNIDYLTAASTSIGGTAESALNEFLIDLPLLNGANVIAAEIHQFNGQSSDISFDASLSMIVPSPTIISTDLLLNVTLTESAAYVARYQPTGKCILPDTIAMNTTLDIGCSPYLASGNTYVLTNVTLTVDPGVEIWFPEKARLIIQGDLQVNGTVNQRVLFKANSEYGAQSWGNISFENSTAVNHLNYLELKDATEGTHPIHNRAAISGWFSEIELDHITLTENFSNPIFGEYSSFTLTNSLLQSAVSGDLINVKYGDGYISDCTFIGNDQPDTDAIDYDRVNNGVIRNSLIEGFYGFNSDAIDLGEQCQDVLVENCLINNITDKGISCGQSSTALVQNNTIVNCNLGLGIKDLGNVTIDHLTLYSVVTGIACFQKNPGLGGGFAAITNSIISNTSGSPASSDLYSAFTPDNCFYDTDTMIGLNCIWQNPRFENPTAFDFNLQNNSPAIGAATDGQNLGTLDHSFTSISEVMISDIQYINADSSDKEFLQILNSGSQIIDLSNYIVSDGIEFVFPEGIAIAPNEKITLVKDITLFPLQSGQVFQWTSGQLDNSGEMLLLIDQHGIIIDHVRYREIAPWPQILYADQYITLVSTALDNHFATSWVATDTVVNHVEEISSQMPMVYPNPAETVLHFDFHSVAVQTIELYNLLGEKMLETPAQNSLDVSYLSSGIYLIRFTDSEMKSVTERFVKE